MRLVIRVDEGLGGRLPRFVHGDHAPDTDVVENRAAVEHPGLQDDAIRRKPSRRAPCRPRRPDGAEQLPPATTVATTLLYGYGAGLHSRLGLVAGLPLVGLIFLVQVVVSR
jgi:hypothetical protein